MEKKRLRLSWIEYLFFSFFLARVARVEKDYPGMGDGRREGGRGGGWNKGGI